MSCNIASSELLQHPIFRDQLDFDQDGGKSTSSGAIARNTIWVHDDMIFVAVRKTVRCAILAPDSPGYKRLNTPLIDFDIRSLIVNRQGSVLLVVGDIRIFAISLSAASFRQADTVGSNEVPVRYAEIGKDYASSPILKVLFNPIARYDANVIILRRSKSVMSFDLPTSYDEPEQTYDLSTFGARDIGFYNASEVQQSIVSMALGNDAIPNGLFTLFLLTEDGDIYSICPWTPGQFLLTKPQAEDIYDSAVLAEFETQDDTALRRQFHRQVIWASEIFSQISAASIETRMISDHGFEDYYIFNRPVRHNPLIQGPFLIQPYPDQLYLEQDGFYASDIQTSNLGFITGIFVSFTNGRIFTLLQDRPVNVKWRADETPALDSLIFFKAFYLEKPTRQTNKIITKFWGNLGDSNETLYAATNEKQIYRIDVSPWSKELLKIIQEDPVLLDNKIFNKLKPSRVEALVANPSKRVNGAIVIGLKTSKKKCLVSVVGDSVWIGAIPTSEEEAAAIDLIDNIEDLADKMDLMDMSYPYESILINFPFEELVRTNLDIKLQLPSQPMDLMSEVKPTLESLEFFASLSDSYSAELSKLLKASLIIRRRFFQQKMELHQQLKKLLVIHNYTTNQDDVMPTGDIGARIQNMLARQEELAARTANVLEGLLQKRSLPLSDKEKRWSKDLEKKKQEIYQPVDGLAKLTEDLKVQAYTIINELYKSHDDDSQKVDTSTNVFSKADQIAIWRFLQKMDRHIREAKTKMENALNSSALVNS